MTENEPKEFQAIYWLDGDECNEDEDESSVDSDYSDSEEEKQDNQDYEYIVRVYGRTLNGKTVSLKLNGFTPYFYLQVRDNITSGEVGRVKYELIELLPKKLQSELLKIKLLQKYKFYGFTNHKKFKFIAIFFKTERARKSLIWALQKKQYIPTLFRQRLSYERYLFESNIPAIIRFFHLSNISPCGWIDFSETANVIERETTSYFEQYGDWSEISAIERDATAPFVVAATDIECFSSDINRMPIPELRTDEVIQIGTTYRRLGEKDCFRKHILTLDTCDDIDGVVVEDFEHEEDLLVAWSNEILEQDPDIITGYNIFGFDFEYLYKRANQEYIANKFDRNSALVRRFGGLSRRKNKISELEIKNLSSSALGDNRMATLPMEGRVVIDMLKVVQRDHNLDSYKLDNVAFTFLGDKKDDVKPREIFEFQKKDSFHRAIVAKYCVQDCELVNNLIDKLCVVPNNMGMANVCKVSLEAIFMRGQSIKIQSVLSYECLKQGYLIMTRKVNENENTTYEGAIVLEPKIGIYTEDPISVMDYASLYPSSMIAENLCHSTYCGCICHEECEGKVCGYTKYNNIPGVDYRDITYDNYKYQENGEKIKDGTKTCRFVQYEQGQHALVPSTLKKLLKARKDTRNKIKTEPDEFKRSVLDGLQLAYKVTANSLYGQIGARTSAIYLKEVAASTTATGRRMIMFAKDFVEKYYPGSVVVYGDTDSIFVKFHMLDENGNKLTGVRALEESIRLGLESGAAISKLLPPPQDLEYEKTFWPWIIFSKKRYAGELYETDPNKHKFKCMGIVLKRRDNAPIVKTIYGGVMDIIMKEKNTQKALEYLEQSLFDLLNGKFPLEQLIITKTLKGNYKNPDGVAHKYLADKMKKRDPGSAPQVNDRIPYVYIRIPKPKRGEKILQGQRIEHPDFIREHGKIHPDYRFYLTNQIQKPVMQILELLVSDPNKIFEKPLREYDNKVNGNQQLEKWFKKSA